MSDQPTLHGHQHCPDGPDPIPCLSGGTTSAYFDDLTFNGTGASVANDTWVEVVTGTGANQRFFNEFNKDPTGGWTRNFATGRINNDNSVSLFSAWGYVVFDVAVGTEIGAGINWFGEEVQANYGIVRDGVKRLIVVAERVPMTASGVSLRAYQKSGATVDILEARLHVRRFEDYSTYEQEFAT